MKLHLPITLLSAVLAAFITLPAQAVEAPEGYTTTNLNTPGELESYSTLTEGDYMAYLLGSALEFSPSSAEYWTSSTPLVSGGNVFFGSNDSDSPVALSFKDSEGPAFSGQNVLTFDTLSNLTFSNIEESAISLAYGGTLTIANVDDGQSETVDVLFKDVKNRTADYGGAIYADHAIVTISNNGDIAFSGNYATGDYTFGGAIYLASFGGAIYAYYGDVTISDNGDVSFSGNYADSGGAIYAFFGDVTISDNGDVSFSGNYADSIDSNYSSYGGAIYAFEDDVTISDNGAVSFSGNYASLGGAISALRGDVTISDNGDVSFSGNHADVHGGAIDADNVTISDNGDVSFSGNYADYGGAIHADNVTISDNGAVSFSGNYVSLASGGAIYAADVTISNNGDVSFSGNYASFSGGAIDAGGGLTISNNGDVSFSGNYADSSRGGAIDADGGLTISNNGDVSFSGNYASEGGAINAGGGLTISNNGDVSFSGNYATGDYSYGGAIYLASGPLNSCTLNIQGNDSVLFEKNYKHSADSYRLRSIYATYGISSMHLSAKTGGNITFRDSVDIYGDSYFNSDYTDAEGNTQSAKGDIIFSGKYAEQHLNEILAANNEARTATAEEVLNSQTSIFKANVYLNGGSLQIKDGAVLKVNGDTVNIATGSDATLAISDAELVASKAKVEVGATGTLQLSNGASVTADQINIAAGATLVLGDIAITTAVSDAMEAAYRLSSLNVINADLTFAAGSTLVTDGTGINMTEGSVLTFNATSEGEKVNLVLTLGAEYSENEQVVLFSNVDIVKFLLDGEEVDSSTTLLASDFFSGDCINENTTLTYDRTSKTVYLQGVSKVVPEPTTATLSLLALAALAMRRRRK